MKVLITGSREWTDGEVIYAALSKLPKSTIIVHGAARGADTYAESAATQLGLSMDRYPADWNTHGKAAGPFRNQQMLDAGVDLVLAFHPDLDSSKGTRDMVNRAMKAGIPVVLFVASRGET